MLRKLDISGLLRDHFKTMSGLELIPFYGVPLGVGAFQFILDANLPINVIELSVSVLAVFSALLLTVQVALFGISQSKIDEPSDDKLVEKQRRIRRLRLKLLREANVNISYLNVISLLLLSICLIIAGFGTNSLISAFVSALYIHFCLILLMLIKRTYALFSKEYK